MESLFFIFTCGEQDIFLQDKYPPKNISNNTFNNSNNLNNNFNNINNLKNNFKKMILKLLSLL